ncbi:MAG: DUF917 domain-containing protein [Peptostreptococcaceae bacterium]|nr:DUF917 domain-containing protein [Peptostreptococcaceae bacterium]
MITKLCKQDILEILYGATFLGGGGGGSLCFGADMLKKLENDKEVIELELLTLDEIEDDAYGAMVAGLGSPVAMLDGVFGPDAVNAFLAFQRAFAAEGKKVKYLYSGEMGGFNTFVPMMVAILSEKDVNKRIKLLDVDGNGRAVPELNTSLASVRGYPPYPIGLGNATGDQVIAYPTDDKAGEVIARQLCMAYGMKIGFSTWGMNKAEMNGNTAVGCVSFAQEIGKAFLKFIADKKFDPMTELKKVMEVREICRGKVEKIDLKAEGGFDFGVITVAQKDGKKFFIDFKNENLIIRDEAGKVYLTAPDIISTLDLVTGEPLTNADVKEGMEILVTASPVEKAWWAEDKKANECWLPLMKMIGYTGAQVRY